MMTKHIPSQCTHCAPQYRKNERIEGEKKEKERTKYVWESQAVVGLLLRI
jgi:hypothetical protein